MNTVIFCVVQVFTYIKCVSVTFHVIQGVFNGPIVHKVAQCLPSFPVRVIILLLKLTSCRRRNAVKWGRLHLSMAICIWSLLVVRMLAPKERRVRGRLMKVRGNQLRAQRF